jgi:hypothetical protein
VTVVPFPKSKPITPSRVLARVKAASPLCVVVVYVDENGDVQLASCEQDELYTIGLLDRARHRMQRLIDLAEGRFST